MKTTIFFGILFSTCVTSQNIDIQNNEVMVRYKSFEEYVNYNEGNLGMLPVPVINSSDHTLSLPVMYMIGTQKGGTVNLGVNIMDHPLLTLGGNPEKGMGGEVHFFDEEFGKYPSIGEWPGDGKSFDSKVVPEVLSLYSQKIWESMKKTKEDAWVTLDKSPRYMIDPLAPYRMNMVVPHAKIIVILRDPTDRYFSQLRMSMCNPEYAFNANITPYHRPGKALEYLQSAEEIYQPYTSICRGEGASAEDLSDCYERFSKHNPLHRGLYAEQLERWFRVFDRSQIMIIESSEMFDDMEGVMYRVSKFVGLPDYNYEYSAGHEHPGCQNNYLSRYQDMYAEESLIREWFKPHNERLYELIGRRFSW